MCNVTNLSTINIFYSSFFLCVCSRRTFFIVTFYLVSYELFLFFLLPASENIWQHNFYIFFFGDFNSGDSLHCVGWIIITLFNFRVLSLSLHLMKCYVTNRWLWLFYFVIFEIIKGFLMMTMLLWFKTEWLWVDQLQSLNVS